jgi:methyl-accepting chemotaxis protein
MSYFDARTNSEDGSRFLSAFEENADQAKERFETTVKQLEDTGVSEIAAGFDTAYASWHQSAREVLSLAEKNQQKAARELAATETSVRFDSLRNYFDDVGAYADAKAEERLLSVSSEGQSSSVAILVTTVLALGGSIALFIVFLRMIILSISTFKKQLDNIAKGEGALARSFNQVLENLQQMIATIQTLSEELGKGADELRQASKDNSKGTDQQTGAISMAATAINEMQSTIEEVAGNASRAAEVTKEADQKGQNSSEIFRKSSVQVHRLAAHIEKAVKVIRALSDNSDKITSILDVIRGVAEQTNLLALNAAIEAARAGEPGRGFAVVAYAVRTLAQRTQKSTADIQTMIGILQSGVADRVSVMETGSQEASEPGHPCDRSRTGAERRS